MNKVTAEPLKYIVCIIYNISGRVVSDILVIQMDVNVRMASKILEIGMILGEKFGKKVYVNQRNFVSDNTTTDITSFNTKSFRREIHTTAKPCTNYGKQKILSVGPS